MILSFCVAMENESDLFLLNVALQVSKGAEAEADGPDQEASQGGNFS